MLGRQKHINEQIAAALEAEKAQIKYVNLLSLVNNCCPHHSVIPSNPQVGPGDCQLQE